MAAHARSESARRVSDCVTALLRDQPFFGSLALSACRSAPTKPARPLPATARTSAMRSVRLGQRAMGRNAAVMLSC